MIVFQKTTVKLKDILIYDKKGVLIQHPKSFIDHIVKIANRDGYDIK